MLAGDAGASAAGAVVAAETVAPEAATSEVSGVSASLDQAFLASEIALVDADVEAGEELAALMHRGVEVVLIDGSADPLSQIGEVLRGRHNIQALHVISHGDSGQLQLGGETIDANRLVAASAELEIWRSSLSPHADILLYGCDVASGDMGGRFIQTLSRLTGADVAASTNRTGASTSHGDWVLEASVGRVEADLFASLADLRAIQVVLPITFDDDASLPNYADFGSVTGLNLNGDARKTGNVLEVTSTGTFRAGTAFYDQAISLTDDASFQSSFSFQMLDGAGIGGDGLTFTIQNDPRGADALGDIGSYMGYQGITNSVSVEFDTFKWSAAEFNNNHVAVNSGTFLNELARAVPGFDLNSGSKYYAWVDYDGATDALSVYVSPSATKPGTALLETTVDLNSLVGDQAYFGFTAGTGFDSSSHRILDWQLEGETASGGLNPGQLALAVSNVTVDEDAGEALIDVLRTGGSDGPVTVAYSTQSGSATEGSDFTPQSDTLNFADGDTVQTIAVPILNDSDPESDEQFSVTIENAGGGATLGTQTTATVTISANDTPVVLPGELAFETGAVTVDEAAGTISIDVLRTGGSAGEVTVDFLTADGTAFEPGDYTDSGGTLTFAEGDTIETIDIPITNDGDEEGDENFSVSLQNPTGGATLGTLTTATVTIPANDTPLAPGELALVTGAVTVDEAAGTISIDVLRTGGSTGEVMVNYLTADGAAIQPGDYTSSSGTLTFAEGDTVETIEVPIINDGDDENNEDFSITLQSPSGGATLGALTTATVTILDNDSGGTVADLPDYADFSSVAGLTLNGDTQQLGNVLELTAAEDFQAGSAFYDQAISLANDASFQSAFSFQMLGGSDGADGLAFAIQGDPAGSAALGQFGSQLGYDGIANVVAVEFDTLDWFASEFNDNHVSVNANSFQNELALPADPGFDLNDGNPNFAWVDYDGVTDALSVFVSETNAKPGAAILQTTVDLASLVGSAAYFGFTAGTGGFNNAHQILSWQLDHQSTSGDPSPGVLGLATSNVTVNEAAGTISIDVLRTGGSTGEVMVNYLTADGAAIQPGDYTSSSGTLTFAEGDTVETIEVPIINDGDDENNEDFSVTLQSPSGGATLGTLTTATVTILDNDSGGTVADLPDYADFSSVAGLTLNGDTQQLGNVLELTAAEDFQAGSAFYDQAISLANDASFQSAFSFQMLGGPDGADGLAFAIQGDPAGSAALGQFGSQLGYDGIANVVAVEFDTLDWFASEFNDNHVSVNANSFQNELALPADPGFDLNDGNPYFAWVDYNGVTDALSVFVSETNAKPGAAILQTTVDLASLVGSAAYFGFTAGTGGFNNAHQILSWQLDHQSTSGGPSPGVLSLATSNVAVSEAAGEVRIDVIRTDGSAGEAMIEFTTLEGTATEGDDFTAIIETLTFVDGDTVETVVIPIENDSDPEAVEQFTVVIQNVVGDVTFGAPRTATVSIIDDDIDLPNYPDFSSVADLNLNGDAQQLGSVLELTTDSSFQVGSAFYDQALSLANDASFRSVFSFQMLGGSGGADGLTFTIQNDPAGADAIGDAGTAMGYDGIINSVAVEFDTIDWLPGEFNDNHVAVSSGGSVANEISRGVPDFDLNDGNQRYAWVDYNGVSDSLAVYVSETPTKPTFALLATTIDLETVVGSEAYFGFTAATGGLSNEHQILDWQLDRQPPALTPPIEPSGTLVANDLITTDITQPIAVDWLPNGTMLIAEKSGIVRTATANVVSETPFIDISDIVNNTRDRGLLDIAVHPDFVNNPYVYLLFTYEGVEPEDNGTPGTLAGPDGMGNRAGRLIRVKADASNNYLTALPENDPDPEREVLLLGANSTRDYFDASVNSTNDLSAPPGGELAPGVYVQDFINSDSESHTVGGLAFSPDGMALYVSTGDGASYNAMDIRADRVQDIDNLSGKILRINPLTGQGLSDNPHYAETNDPNSDSSKVYQRGLRNPFRIAIDDATGELYVGEVGWRTWEEINSAGAGANFGWPFYEGGNGVSVVQDEYAATSEGQAFFSGGGPTVTPSIYALNHQADGINAIVMGDVLNSTAYGSEYLGDVFFNDLGQGIVRHASIDVGGNVTDVNVFDTGAEFVVMITQGPDGHLYYVDLDSNKIGRWELV